MNAAPITSERCRKYAERTRNTLLNQGQWSVAGRGMVGGEFAANIAARVEAAIVSVGSASERLLFRAGDSSSAGAGGGVVFLRAESAASTIFANGADAVSGGNVGAQCDHAADGGASGNLALQIGTRRGGRGVRVLSAAQVASQYRARVCAGAAGQGTANQSHNAARGAAGVVHGTASALIMDHDGDGVRDAIAGAADPDADDGVLTAKQFPGDGTLISELDRDSDGVLNYLDPDDVGDRVLTRAEDVVGERRSRRR